MLTETERRQLALTAETIRQEIAAAEKWLDHPLIRTGVLSDIFVAGMIYHLRVRLNAVEGELADGPNHTRA